MISQLVFINQKNIESLGCHFMACYLVFSKPDYKCFLCNSLSDKNKRVKSLGNDIGSR